jgi:hypothetical protein
MSDMRFGSGLDGRRIAFIVCLLGLFAYEGYALFVQEGGATSHLPPARDLHLTREVNQAASLQQTFVMHTDGFQGVEFVARASDQPAIGPLDVVVSAPDPNRGDEWVPLGRQRIDASSIALGSFTRVTVPRIDYSAGFAYRIEIAMPDAPPGHGLRFEAGGPTYEQGRLMIGGREEWGDLKFRTVAQRATVFRSVRHLRTTLPPILREDAVWVIGLIAINWALATIVYYLGFARDETAGAAKGSVAGTADQPRV